MSLPCSLCPARGQRPAATPRFHGGHALLSPVGSWGHRPPRDTDSLPLSPTPGRLKCPRIRPALHCFKPRRLLFFVAGARPGTGGNAVPAHPRGRRCADRTACGRQRRKKIKTKQTKNHPQPRGPQLQHRLLFLGQGETRARGKSEISVPAEPCCSRAALAASRGRGQSPGGVGCVPGGNSPRWFVPADRRPTSGEVSTVF